MGFGVWGLGVGVSEFESRVAALRVSWVPEEGSRASGFVSQVPGSGFRFPVSGFRVPGFGFPGSGFPVPGFGFRISGFRPATPSRPRAPYTPPRSCAPTALPPEGGWRIFEGVSHHFPVPGLQRRVPQL